MDNKYVNHSRISEAKFRELVRLFALDLTATQIAELSHLNRNTVNKYLRGIRKRIAEYRRVMALPGLREAPADENAKTAMLGILEKDGSIYSCLLQTKKARQLKETLAGKRLSKEDLNNSAFSHLDMLLEPDTFNCLRLFGDNMAQKDRHAKTNRIAGFVGYTKTRLEKFKGMHDSTFWLHWKECEFRFNHEADELYPLILKIIRKNPLF